MKVSLSWLREYIPVELDPQEVADRLTMAGLEVDAMETLYDYLDHVVVGQVVDTRPHPNADKLTCCTVNVGQEETAAIVCGAPNVRKGMRVACALPGAVLPGDFKIKKSKLRGEPSCGMLCSAAELRLADDAAGIMDLDESLVPGTALEQALNLSDTVFEIDLTPNRPDCLSAVGIAREIAAFSDPVPRVSLPGVEFPKARISDTSIRDLASVEIKDPDLCGRYTAGMLLDVKVGPSPLWLKQRLESLGLTPINNVVDITNFVMMETGQPLHAFDYDNLAGGKIVVRRAGSAIEFTTLDSKVHKLEPDALMICDGEKPVGIAGVMGGENSEITENTTRVLVESAYFNPVSIRRTAKKSGISTDASHRFERGVDPEGTVFAMRRAVSLMAELCNAMIAADEIDEHPVNWQPVVIDLRAEALNSRLGTQFSDGEIKQILESVGFDVKMSGPGLLKVSVPSFRVDVARPEDLSEEVARIWGYNKIPTSYPKVPLSGKPLAPKLLLREHVRGAMTAFGFSEAINYSFIPSDSNARLGLLEDDPRQAVVEILNPISEQMSVMRTSLLPGLLECMHRNTAQQNETLRLFETGKVFFSTSKDQLPTEVELLGGIMSGERTGQAWHSKKITVDFYDLKGVVEGLLCTLHIPCSTYVRIEDDSCPYFEAGYGARIIVDDRVIGSLGKICKPVLKAYGLKQDAYAVEMDMAELLTVCPEKIEAASLPKFPSISRDMTFIMDQGVEAGSVLDEISGYAKSQALIEAFFLFDLFEGDSIGQGKKSLSFRVIYRSPSKTLTEKNIKKIHETLSRRIIDRFGAGLPG